MVISLHTTQSPVSRSERMKINENWQRIIEGLSKLQLQINILAGGEEVDELILRINQAIEMVSTALQDTEKVIIEANKATMDAQEASNNANTAVQVVNEAMGEAGQLMENLGALKAELEQMKYKLETLSTEAEAATVNANNAAQVVTNLTDVINEAITVANNATQEANNAAQLIAGWGTASVWNATTEYVKNNITTYNGSTWQSLTTNKNSVPSESNKDWILLAQRGVDGTGSVSMVAGKSPDADGNVPLTSIDIGAETPSGAQEKANKIQEWVQAHGLGTNQPELITLPDSLLNKKESGFWNVENKPGSVSLPNDIEDFHVYVGIKSDDQSDKIYQTFLAISQKTAKTYTRVITNDGQVNNHLDDTGWIEGGEGGTGDGLKLNINTYDLQTTMDNQKSWNIPKESYDKNNDEILVFHNGIYLPPVSWDITGNVSDGYVLTIPENPIAEQINNNVSILILKNVPTTGDEQFSGSLLTDGSVTMNKLSQDVQDKINSASEKVEIVDNLTVGGSNKALSAEMGKNLKAIVDEKVDKLELDVLETEVNEHLVQMKPKVNNSWQKGVYNDVNITNLSAVSASKVLNFSNWDADNSKLDSLYINIPVGNSFSGLIKLTLAGSWLVGNSMGGAEVVFNVSKIGETTYFNTMQINQISSQFAKCFYIKPLVVQDTRLYIPITKAPNTRNDINIKVDIFSIANIFNVVSNITLDRDSAISQAHPWNLQTPFTINTYNPSNTITNIGVNRATRVFPQVNWKEAGIELWETSFSLPSSVWGILELDIAGYSACSGGAKIVVELGINVTSQSQPSTVFKNVMKVVTSSDGFMENFYVEVEHRPEVRGLYIKVYKRKYNDPITVVATFTSTVSPMSAFDLLEGFHDGWLFNNIAEVPVVRQKDFDTRIKENFTLFSSFKQKIVSATTDKGVPTNADATGDVLATNIRAIPTGSKMQSGTMQIPAFSGSQTVSVNVYLPFVAKNAFNNMGGFVFLNGSPYGAMGGAGPYTRNITVAGTTLTFTFAMGGGTGSYAGGPATYFVSE